MGNFTLAIDNEHITVIIW